MSISDLIVVMKDGKIQQIGQPQRVYDSPANLFVAKFLGSPPINVFSGAVRGGKLTIGGEAVRDAAGVGDQPVTVGVRPEGFVLRPDGAFTCRFQSLEVMGREVSVILGHDAAAGGTLRAIIGAENSVDTAAKTLRFDLKPEKVFAFHADTEERLI